MRIACLSFLVCTAAAAGCTQHTDGECVWLPGSDGTCGNSDTGGGSTDDTEYVRYPSATVASTGAATFVFAAKHDDRGGDSIVIGAMRERGLPDRFDPWTVGVDGPRALRAWSATDRALLAIEDASGWRVVEVDPSGTASGETAIERFDDAVHDGQRWWLVRREAGPDLAEPDDVLSAATLDGTLRIELVAALAGRGVDLPAVTPLDGGLIVAWRETDSTTSPAMSDAHAARIVGGELVEVATVAHESSGVTSLFPLPDAVWIDTEIVAFDGTRRSIMQMAPHELVALPDGSFVGIGEYDATRVFRYDGPIADANYRILHTASEPIHSIAAHGNEFVALEGYASGTATFSDGGEVDSVVIFETTAYGGCSAGGSGGSLALVGLALLTCLGAAHPARTSRRIAR